MLAAYIRIDHIRKDFWFRKNLFRVNFFDVHELIICFAVIVKNHWEGTFRKHDHYDLSEVS
jgi:hypothetical protein